MSVTDRYFLAANGFSGFRCHFSSLLNSDDVRRVYIIKGGSGVGKSTLMRSVSSHFSNKGFPVEEILCSSDPSSLDGVIIRSKQGSTVLIDGTAPHEYDMKFPAMRDVIIDLSRHLDDKAFDDKRDLVIEVIKSKKKCYDFAYRNLHLAGNSYNILLDTIAPYAKHDKIKDLADKLFPKDVHSKAKIKSVLYSAFSKDGIVSLDVNDSQYKSVYCFDAGFKTHLIFSLLIDEIKGRSADITVFSSPFSDDLADGFSVNGDILFKITDESPTCMSDCYFDTPDGEDREALAKCENIFNMALDIAKGALKRAFKNHRELEQIYGANMDFTKNSRLLENLIEKIAAEL